jgi:hypothetical protein
MEEGRRKIEEGRLKKEDLRRKMGRREVMQLCSLSDRSSCPTTSAGGLIRIGGEGGLCS